MMDKPERLKKQLLIEIKNKLKREGWSQGYASRLCGIARTHFNNVLRGTADAVGLNRLIRMAEGIGLEVELIIRDVGKRKAE